MRWFLLATLVFPASAAFAGNDSIVTLGIGSHAVVAQAAGTSGGSSTTLGQGFSARLRFLRVLGAELSYDLISHRNSRDLNVPAPVFKWSGLLYLIPHTRFSLYLLGGFGATSAGDLLSPQGATTSYHGGAGIEIGITRNWILSLEYRVNLPAVNQVAERGMSDALAEGSVPTITRYYNLDTWQLNVGFRFYL
jgi:opacity protein-like surface antigen